MIKGMLSGSCLEKLIVVCIFMQYDIRPVFKIYEAEHVGYTRAFKVVTIEFQLKRHGSLTTIRVWYILYRCDLRIKFFV